MSDVQKLLDEISHLVDVDKKLKEEKRVRGEMFNIFSVLGLTSDEVRLHSTFLATLLNPKADHGQGEGFLKAFAERLDFPLDYASTKVEVEKGIGLVKDDHGGRIDILVSDNQKHGIIIENKIYAGDQPKQLTRYWNDAQKRFGAGNYCLVYLTLNGDEPSKDSTAGMPKKNKDEHAEYICLSYKDDILPWLEQCVALSVRQPLIRETLNQYIGVVRRLTYCDMENKDELLKKMREHLDAVFAINANVDEMIENIIVEVLLPQLRKLAEDKKMDFAFYHKKDPIGKDGGDASKLMCYRAPGWHFINHAWQDFDISLGFENGKELRNLIFGFRRKLDQNGNFYRNKPKYWEKLPECITSTGTWTASELWVYKKVSPDCKRAEELKKILSGAMIESIKVDMDELLRVASTLDTIEQQDV